MNKHTHTVSAEPKGERSVLWTCQLTQGSTCLRSGRQPNDQPTAATPQLSSTRARADIVGAILSWWRRLTSGSCPCTHTIQISLQEDGRAQLGCFTPPSVRACLQSSLKNMAHSYRALLRHSRVSCRAQPPQLTGRHACLLLNACRRRDCVQWQCQGGCVALNMPSAVTVRRKSADKHVAHAFMCAGTTGSGLAHRCRLSARS
jgi:hypothetical protein